MKTSNGLINQISDKVEKLIELHRKIQDDHEDLQRENIRLNEIIKEQEITIKELDRKINNIAIAKQLTNKKEALEIKKTINELVREIDKCVGLLDE